MLFISTFNSYCYHFFFYQIKDSKFQSCDSRAKAYETLVTNTCSRMMEFGDFPYSKYNKNGKQPEYLTHQQVKILKIWFCDL